MTGLGVAAPPRQMAALDVQTAVGAGAWARASGSAQSGPVRTTVPDYVLLELRFPKIKSRLGRFT